MAPPQLSSRPSAQAGEGKALLATKVVVPRLPPDLLSRPRLLRTLTEATQRVLVLVCTPAGFGKTSLLASWAQSSRRPVAWLSLDHGDNDPVRFWHYLAAALQRGQDQLSDREAGLLPGPNPSSPEGLVAALTQQLAGLPEGLVLVLDDYHVIDSEPIHQALALLLTYAPEGFHLVIASRADPPLPLARLRARGQLAELRVHDLRFTAEETSALLREAWGLELADESVAVLETRTEGWAAGLQLVALSLRGRSDPAGFVQAFTGAHRFVLDYLSEEVLDRQPERLRRFLLESSILDRLGAPVCEAITGRTDAEELLAEAERANLFLVPLDEERRWYRYHPLFAELLRARLRQQQPDRERELHRLAAGWHEAHGLVDDAIRHALGAGEPLWAARLVERHVEELINRGERVTLDRWVSALPEEVVRSRPRLLLTMATSRLIAGRLAEAEQLIGMADTVPLGEQGQHDPSVGREASLTANIAAAAASLRAMVALLRGDASGERSGAAKAVTRLTSQDRVLGTFPSYHFAMADWLDGRVREAEQGLTSVVAERQAAGEPFLALWAAYDLGQVQRARGRLRAAMGTYRAALEEAAPPGRAPMPAAGMALVGMAGVELQRGHLADALGHATEGVGLCRQLVNAGPLVSGLAILAWIRQVTGDPAEALEAIAEAERVVSNREAASLLNPSIPIRPQLLLAKGDITGVQRWAEERGVSEDSEPQYPREPEYLVLARLLLAQHAPERALRLLDPLANAAAAQQRIDSLIQARALQALAFQATGDHRQALDVLAGALRLGWPEGYVRVFADEGPPMAALLRRLVATRQRGGAGVGQQVPMDYLGRVLRALQPAGQRPAPLDREATVMAGLVEPLTDRELEVLRLLAAGRRNREIADQLVVTLDTVKKHLSHIFDKLGATNRTQALAHARQLGLIR
jgi:LuxR family transcriptional regulator, maltose regulon positive regulatory protein